MWSLFLLVVILDLIVSVRSMNAPCDLASCVENFSLTGDNRQFCVGANIALECVDDIKHNHKCSNINQWQLADTFHRLEKMSGCVCSLGSTHTYSLPLSVGLVTLAYVLTSFK